MQVVGSGATRKVPESRLDASRLFGAAVVAALGEVAVDEPVLDVVDVVVVVDVVDGGAVVVGAVVVPGDCSALSPGRNSGASPASVDATPGAGSVAPSAAPPSELLHAARRVAPRTSAANGFTRCRPSTRT